MALISASLDRLGQTKTHECALRFAFGGVCTAAAGWIAQHYGPEVGGLFLAFPAIFPAGATLIASHERERKAKAGLNGTTRGREAAALDATGASLAGVGLGIFGLILWMGLPGHNAVAMIAAASAGWAIASGLLWLLWKRSPVRRFRQPVHPARHALRKP